MNRKKLAVAIATTVLACSAQGAFNAGGQALSVGSSGYLEWSGTDSDLIFFAHDTSNTFGSYFINLTAIEGITVDSLMSSNYSIFHFSNTAFNPDYDFSFYDSWGIFATSNDISTSYSYSKMGNALGGILASAETPIGITGGNEYTLDPVISGNEDWISAINAELGGADEGAVAANSAADYDGGPFGLPVIRNSPLNANYQRWNIDLYLHGILDRTPEPLFASEGIYDEVVEFNYLGTVTLGRPDFYAETALIFTTVPIPAAAWFFGSALIGLAGLKRRTG